jgi:hypothetical protein
MNKVKVFQSLVANIDVFACFFLESLSAFPGRLAGFRLDP